MSIASVALANGLNANLLRRWIEQGDQRLPSSLAPSELIDPRFLQPSSYLQGNTEDLPESRSATAHTSCAWEVDVRKHASALGRQVVGRQNWLFAGSLRAGQRAAAVMSLVHSARLNGHEPHAYLKDVLERLPTHPASRIAELLPHQWQPTRAPT